MEDGSFGHRRGRAFTDTAAGRDLADLLMGIATLTVAQ